MNSIIASYFDTIETRLLASAAVLRYQILRREITITSGLFRLKTELSDSGTAEFFEYVVELEKEIEIL